jgi:hypothetical protein
VDAPLAIGEESLRTTARSVLDDPSLAPGFRTGLRQQNLPKTSSCGASGTRGGGLGVVGCTPRSRDFNLSSLHAIPREEGVKIAEIITRTVYLNC